MIMRFITFVELGAWGTDRILEAMGNRRVSFLLVKDVCGRSGQEFCGFYGLWNKQQQTHYIRIRIRITFQF
jgi:hypothetical protein